VRRRTLARLLLAAAGVAAPPATAAAQRIAVGGPAAAPGGPGVVSAARPAGPPRVGGARHIVPVAPQERAGEPRGHGGEPGHGFLPFPVWYLGYGYGYGSGDGWGYDAPGLPPAPPVPATPPAAPLVLSGPGAPELAVVERQVGRSKVIDVGRDSGRAREDAPRPRGRP
jgi:hypothetical protein